MDAKRIHYSVSAIWIYQEFVRATAKIGATLMRQYTKQCILLFSWILNAIAQQWNTCCACSGRIEIALLFKSNSNKSLEFVNETTWIIASALAMDSIAFISLPPLTLRIHSSRPNIWWKFQQFYLDRSQCTSRMLLSMICLSSTFFCTNNHPLPMRHVHILYG